MTSSGGRILTNKSTVSQKQGTSASINRSTSQQYENSKSQVGTLGGFQKGQVIKGEIIDLRDKDVKIQLEDSRIIQAKMEDSDHVSIGDNASFLVTKTGISSMSLQMLSKGFALSQEFLLEKALDEAGLPHTEKNLTAVRELLNNQLPINKPSIQLLLRQAALFKNASLETLALMNKLNMPMNETTAVQFEAYRHFEHRILNQLESFTESLLSDNLSEESALQIIDILKQEIPSSNGYHTADKSLLPIHSILNSEECLNLTELLESIGANHIDQSSLLSGNMPLHEAAHAILEAGIKEALKQEAVKPETIIEEDVKLNTDIEKADMHFLDEKTEVNDSIPARTSDGNFQGVIDHELLNNLPESLNKPEVHTILENYINAAKQNTELSTITTAVERKELLTLLSPLELSEEFKSMVLKGETPAKDMLPVFKEFLSAADMPKEPLLHNPAYQSITKELLTNRWTLTPDELTKPDALDHYYKKLEDDMKILEKQEQDDIKNQADVFNNTSSKQNGPAANIKDNIDFMKTLNQIFTYLQMPIKLPNKNIHSELFVYTNKKSLRQNKNQIKVLLHLDMSHLGPLDIHIELADKSVMTKFYVENDKAASVISDNLTMLNVSLEDKGYQHISEILKRDKEIDIVEDFIAPKNMDLDMKRYMFDKRA